MKTTLNNQTFETLVGEKILEILDHFGIEYKTFENYVSMPCFIHGSDNESSLAVYTSPSDGGQIGNWCCWSGQCHKRHGNGPISLVKAILSLNGPIEWWEAKKWCLGHLGVSEEIEETKSPYVSTAINRVFSKQVLSREKSHLSREDIRARLQIPAQNYLLRGYSKEVLDKYDVGFCNNKGKLFYNRTIFPFYGENMEYIGCLGRNVNEICKKCNFYHSSVRKCPENDLEKFWGQKWINSKGFHTGENFYNYWLAKDHIKRYNTAILAEGQGDILRLEESGIHIGLGLFGRSFTASQKLLLEKLPILNIIIATDNDTKGDEARIAISNKLKNMYNLHYVNIPKKDIGDLTIDETKKLFNPVLSKLLIK